MTTEKKPDGENLSLIWITVIFGGLVLGVSLFYSAWDYMGAFWKAVGYIALIVNVALTIMMFVLKNDPKYDVVRVIFCVFAVVTALYIGGFRVAKNETVDSNSIKQEQVK